MAKGGSSPMGACEFRGHLDTCNGIRHNIGTEDPEEVLVVAGLGEIVIRAGRHGDQVSPKIVVTVGSLRLGEKARRRNMLTRRGSTRARETGVGRLFWLLLANY